MFRMLELMHARTVGARPPQVTNPATDKARTHSHNIRVQGRSLIMENVQTGGKGQARRNVTNIVTVVVTYSRYILMMT